MGKAPNTRDSLPGFLRDLDVRLSRQERRVFSGGRGGGGGAGPPGPSGPAGPAGPAGIGIPAGGLTDEFLAKASNADYDTLWVPGVRWQIQTIPPPLARGADQAEMFSLPEAMIELDRIGVTPDARVNELVFHPMTQYGSTPTYWRGAGDVSVPGFEVVNPYETDTFVFCYRYGKLRLQVADQFHFYNTDGADMVVVPPGTTIDESNATSYGLDIRYTYAYFDFDWDWYCQTWLDTQRHYLNQQGTDQAYCAQSGEPYFRPGFVELFADGFGDYPDFESYGGVWASAPAPDRDFGVPYCDVTLRSFTERSANAAGYGSPYVDEELQLRLNAANIRIYDGEHNSQVPDGELCRGGVAVLQSVVEVTSTASDPCVKQWYRQIGEQAVAFTAGVGGITTVEKMGTSKRHVQATVVGTTVGGPMIAQVSSPDPTHINFYLSTAHTGTLDVSWSAEFSEPDWSTTQPVVGYIDRGDLAVGGRQVTYFLHEDKVLIPYSATSGLIDLRLVGTDYDSGTLVYDSTGTVRGTVSGLDTSSTRHELIWTVNRNWYSLLGGDYFHLRNSDGQRSNIWRMQWANVPMVP